MMEFELKITTAPGVEEQICVPEKTTLQELAERYQKNYDSVIVLACVNGKLRELNKEVKKSGEVTFLTMADRDGKRTYRRSVTLLMQKAVENLWQDKVKVRVYYSLGEGYYCELKGRDSDTEAIEKIREEMRKLVNENLPIQKCSVKTEE